MWLNINRNGRLGNRLFSRAHVIAAAIELKQPVIDYGLSDVSHNFPNIRMARVPIYGPGSEVDAFGEGIWGNPKILGLLRLLRPRRSGRRGPFWSCYWKAGADPDLMRLDTREFHAFLAKHKTVILDGYKLRCTQWVRKHAPSIRHMFEPHAVLRDKWVKIINRLHQDNDLVVGIHMRSQDFKSAQGGRYYLSPAEYAEIVRERVSWRGQRVFFLLFSDDPFIEKNRYTDLCKAFEGIPYLFVHGSEIDDIVGLSACDKIVCPLSSTYSRWAAFQGKREWLGVSRRLFEDGAAFEFDASPIPWDY